MSGLQIYRFIVFCAAMLIALHSTALHAARPLLTDDARLTDAGACQIESWRRSNRTTYEFWAFPACNLTGNLELTLGGNSLPGDTEGRAHDIVVQGKTLFKPLTTNGYGYGLAAGMVRHTAPGMDQGRLSSFYAYMPASFSFLDDRIVMHINLGIQNSHDTRLKPATWGLGGEFMITPRFIVVAETFGDNHNLPSFQAGIRFWVVPNRVQIDTTMGTQAGSIAPSRWWTVGLRLISPPFVK